MTLFFAYSSCHVVSSSFPFLKSIPDDTTQNQFFGWYYLDLTLLREYLGAFFLGCKTNFDVRVLQVRKSQNNNSKAQLRFVFGMINSQLLTFAGSTGSAGPTGPPRAPNPWSHTARARGPGHTVNHSRRLCNPTCCVCIYLSIYLSSYLSIYLSIYLNLYVYIYIYVTLKSTCLIETQFVIGCITSKFNLCKLKSWLRVQNPIFSRSHFFCVAVMVIFSKIEMRLLLPIIPHINSHSPLNFLKSLWIAIPFNPIYIPYPIYIPHHPMKSHEISTSMKSQICFATPRWHIAGANVPHLQQLRLHLATVAAAVGMAPSHHCAIAADGLMATDGDWWRWPGIASKNMGGFSSSSGKCGNLM